jgi:transcriptional regulator with XRE-family HTH domain
MKDKRSGLDLRIADRVRELRAARAISLEKLSRISGVSRSMISVIERGKSSPTAAILEKLAAALNVTLASLFDSPEPDRKLDRGPISRRGDQPVWKDPGSGYVRLNVSPPGFPQPMQIVEVLFPPGKRVSFEAGPRDDRIYQQIWILDGVMEITLGKDRHRLLKGDCLAMELGSPTMFHNPTKRTTRYAVVLASHLARRGR